MPLIPLTGDRVTQEVEGLLEASHGSPSGAKAAATEYREGRWALYAWSDGISILGCIGIERQIDGSVIRSLSVKRSHRLAGVGRAMVEAALADARWVEAETDADAVGFYKQIGFTITSLRETYPGVERFRCIRASFDVRAHS